VAEDREKRFDRLVIQHFNCLSLSLKNNQTAQALDMYYNNGSSYRSSPLKPKLTNQPAPFLPLIMLLHMQFYE